MLHKLLGFPQYNEEAEKMSESVVGSRLMIAFEIQGFHFLYLKKKKKKM